MFLSLLVLFGFFVGWNSFSYVGREEKKIRNLVLEGFELRNLDSSFVCVCANGEAHEDHFMIGEMKQLQGKPKKGENKNKYNPNTKQGRRRSLTPT